MSDPDEPRTFSFLVVFLILAVIGLLGLAATLVFGGSESPTESLPTRRTTTTTTEATTSTPAPVVTMPGGAEAPPEIRSVLSQGGQTSYSFVVPEALADDRVRAVVAVATATPNPDGSALVVRVRCTAGAAESVAQITVSESPESVTVLPVVLTPADAAPCSSDLQLAEIALPLTQPLGARGVVVAPPGTSVPIPRPG